jgi:spermidine synthase
LVAAVGNLGVALIAYNVARQEKKTHPRSALIKEEPPASGSSHLENEKSRRIEFLGFLIISAMVGYISLSQEILWVRLASFHTASKATVFGNVLGSFLVGLAIGAGVGKRLSIRFCERIPEIIALLLIGGSLFYYTATPVIGWIATVRQGTGLPALLICAALVAGVLGAIFPLLSHHSIRNKAAVGASLGWLYFANIVGATLGPLVTGFVLLDKLTVQENVLLLALSGLCVGAVLLVATARYRLSRTPWGRILGGVGLTTALIVSYGPLYRNLLERLYYRTSYQYAESFLATVQNRSGIINVERSDRGGHVVLGGGIYDGRFNTDLLNNHNGIDRAYIFATLHPKLIDVLEIGLGTGSWATVVSSDPRVKKLDIVEINPGYRGLIREFGQTPSILDDPRVTIHTDDGRRWLSRNPDRKYDAILMNTSYHWRAFASHVLSREFLELCRRHLNPGGIVFYNSTHSKDVEFTAAYVFQHVTKYANFVAASDSPFLVSAEDRIQMLFSMHPSRMDLPSKRRADLDRVIEQLARTELTDRRDTLLSLSDHRQLITDDNLATEFKQSRGARIWPGSWLSLLSNWDNT